MGRGKKKKPKRVLRKLGVGSIAAVAEGDNPLADMMIWKRKPKGGDVSVMKKFHERLAEIRKVLGSEPDEETKKRLFDEIREDRVVGDAFDALWRRNDMLIDSISEILFVKGENEVSDKAAAIRATIEQFADSIDEDLSDIMAGRVNKRFEGIGVPLERDEMGAALKEEFVKASAELAASREGEQDMKIDLSKLSDEARTAVEELIEKGEKYDKLSEDHETLKAKVEELEKQKPAEGEGDDEEAFLKSLPEGARALFTKMREENQELRKEVHDSTTAVAKATFRKTCDFKHLPLEDDEIADTLFEIDDVAKRDKVHALLKAVNTAAAENEKLLKEIGSSHSHEQTTDQQEAAAMVQKRAESLIEKNPDMTIEAARSEVRRNDRDLYRREQGIQ